MLIITKVFGVNNCTPTYDKKNTQEILRNYFEPQLNTLLSQFEEQPPINFQEISISILQDMQEWLEEYKQNPHKKKIDIYVQSIIKAIQKSLLGSFNIQPETISNLMNNALDTVDELNIDNLIAKIISTMNDIKKAKISGECLEKFVRNAQPKYQSKNIQIAFDFFRTIDQLAQEFKELYEQMNEKIIFNDIDGLIKIKTLWNTKKTNCKIKILDISKKKNLKNMFDYFFHKKLARINLEDLNSLEYGSFLQYLENSKKKFTILTMPQTISLNDIQYIRYNDHYICKKIPILKEEIPKKLLDMIELEKKINFFISLDAAQQNKIKKILSQNIAKIAKYINVLFQNTLKPDYMDALLEKIKQSQNSIDTGNDGWISELLFDLKQQIELQEKQEIELKEKQEINLKMNKPINLQMKIGNLQISYDMNYIRNSIKKANQKTNDVAANIKIKNTINNIIVDFFQIKDFVEELQSITNAKALYEKQYENRQKSLEKKIMQNVEEFTKINFGTQINKQIFHKI